MNDLEADCPRNECSRCRLQIFVLSCLFTAVKRFLFFLCIFPDNFLLKIKYICYCFFYFVSTIRHINIIIMSLHMGEIQIFISLMRINKQIKFSLKDTNKEASRLYAELLLMSSRSMQMLSLMSSRSTLIIGTSSLTCGWHADDMQLLPGVVLFKIRELKQVKSQRNQTNH